MDIVELTLFIEKKTLKLKAQLSQMKRALELPEGFHIVTKSFSSQNSGGMLTFLMKENLFNEVTTGELKLC